MSLETITGFLESTGCSFPDIDLLQPADPFLDTTGEDLRRRIFITQENSGSLFCLRPEFTIPVGLKHLESSGAPARYAYGGKVFRQRQEDPIEFVQAGFEDIGDDDKASADTRSILTALGVLEACDASDVRLVVGDQSIFTTLLNALDIPAAWQKKLVRGFGDDSLLNNLISEMSDDASDSSGRFPPAIEACLEKDDDNLLVSVVTDMMLADGLPLSGGRTPAAIIHRIKEKAELGQTRLEPEKREILEDFLKLHVPLNDAAVVIGDFADRFGLKLPGASQTLANLHRGLEKKAEKAIYRASFGRRLDYYTGLVFELYLGKSDKPVIGGGRYDQLMTLLGAEKEIPAVGFAVWVDRIVGGAS